MKGIEVDENEKDENSDKTKQMENIQEDGNGKKDVEHGKLAVENIHPQEKEKGEGLKSELDGKEHDNNLENKNSGCHIENMIGYVNNKETFGRDKNESMVETVCGNVDGLNTNDDVTVADMLFQGETEEEKEERIQVIGTSLKISQLEDDLDNILQKKLRVSDTEERIDRLKNVITLLQGFTYSGKEKEDKKEDKDSLKTGENDGNKKESEEQHTEKDKSDECQKGIKEHNSVHNRSKEDDENEEEKEEDRKENGSSLPVSKNLEEYVKSKETNVDIEKTEKKKDQIEERNDENINESTGKTEENTSDQTDTGNKCSVENGSENEKKYVNMKDLETMDKEEDKKSGEVLEEVELHKKSEGGRQFINEEECKDNVENVGVDSEDKKQKKVCFDLDENDMENDQEFVKIQVEVGQVVKTVIGMEEDNDGDKNKIDDFYVNLPSSQTRFSEHMADLDNKMKTLEKEKYQVNAEDISDAEEGNETNTEEIVEVEKQEKEEEGEIRKDEELEKGILVRKK